MARVTWKDKISGEKAQFVADTLNESLFNYAFDSNKSPSLNLHFFCLDFLSTYNSVENGSMKEGNMQPLNEEFEYIINESPWLPNNISNSILYFKNKEGIYKNISKEKNLEIKKRAEYYKESANHILRLLSSDNNYLKLLLGKIREILNSPTFELNDKQELYFCVREYLSELISVGYSKEHLYNRVRKKLFSKKKSKDDVKFIMDFLDSLIAEKEDYDVVIGISDDVYIEFKDLIKEIRIANDYEKKQLFSEYVIQTTVKSVDPVSALKHSKKNFWMLINIHNACIHNNNMQIVSNGLVSKKGASSQALINDSLNLLTKSPSKTKEERLEWTIISIKRNVSISMLNALSLHNNALKIEEPQTQLLTLWSVFEVLIDTKQNFMSRSNFVTNVLCSILCNKYYFHILNTLYSQISLSKAAKSIIHSEARGKNQIEKLSYILKDNVALQASLKTSLQEFPLESYKIEYYATVFFSKEKMHSNLIRHSNRLRWQIMRIYRNRCMIVHNGKNLPYIESILENLHFYVDETLNYIFSKISVGISDIDAIFSCARVKESSNIAILEDKKNPITDEEYYNIIFNY